MCGSKYSRSLGCFFEFVADEGGNFSEVEVCHQDSDDDSGRTETTHSAASGRLNRQQSQWTVQISEDTTKARGPGALEDGNPPGRATHNKRSWKTNILHVSRWIFNPLKEQAGRFSGHLLAVLSNGGQAV